MATTNEQINIKLQLDAAEAEAISLRIKKTLEDAAVAATRIKITPAYEGANVARSSSGRFVGRQELEDRAAAAAAGTVYVKPVKRSSAMAAAQAPAPISQRTVSESSLSRSVAGQTGSDSRDFAKQAQGLGGLVHVYATFAANAFAASAAFMALSKAADTSNMIKGLEQLSASGGVSLTALAKQMVSVSDGAISLRQAMSSTALAASSGMTSSQILKMTEIAKKASLALGRDMTDSMDRLTKGIVKVQPELLDELGIMARVIPSQQAYARSVGKSVDALTQYEKQLAFTNAVLTEGTRKFSDIDIDSNSFSKLSAALDNVVFSGLRTVNLVLEPIVKLLAASPTGLTAVLAGIAAVLLKQAIPALGQFKKGAEEANRLNLARVSALFLNNEQALGQNDAKLQDHAAQERKKYEATKAYTDLAAVDKAKAVKQASDLETKYINDRKINTSAFYSHDQILERNRASVLSNAAQTARKVSVQQTAEQLGSIAAYRQMNQELSKSRTMGTTVLNGLKEADGSPATSVAAKTGALSNGFERMGLIAGIAGGGVMRLVGSLGKIGLVISLVTGAAAYIVSFFQEASKEAEEFDRALEYSKDTLKTYDTVVKKFAKQSAFNKNSIEELIAYSAAIKATTEATEKLSDAFDAYAKKANFADKATQFLANGNWWSNAAKGMGALLSGELFSGKGFQGKMKIVDGMQQNIAEQLESDILKIGARVKGSAAEKQFKEDLSSILNINLTKLASDSDQFKKVIENIDYDKLFAAKDSLIGLSKTTLKTILEETAGLKEFSSSLQILNQDYDAFNATLTNTDPFAKLGNSALKFGMRIGDSFNKPKAAAAEFKKFLEDTGNFRMFSPELQQDLVNLNSLVTKINDADTKKTELRDKTKNPNIKANEILDISREIGKIDRVIKIDTAQYERSTKDNILQQRVSVELMTKGLKDLEVSSVMARAKSGIEFSQKLLSLSMNSEAGIKLKGELDKKLIDNQNLLIEAVHANTLANYNLGQITEKGLIATEKDRIAVMAPGEAKKKAQSAVTLREIVLGINEGMMGRKADETLTQLNAALNSPSPPVQLAAQARSQAVIATQGKNDAKYQAGLAKQGVDVSTSEQLAALQVRQAAEISDYQIKLNALKNEGLSVSEQDLGYQIASVVQAKFLNQEETRTAELEKKRGEIISLVEQQGKRIGKDPKINAAIIDSVKNYGKQLNLLNDINTVEGEIAARKNDRAVDTAVISNAKYLSDLAIKTNNLNLSGLNTLQDTLGVRSENLANAKKLLEINNIEQELNKEQVAYGVNILSNEKELARLKSLPTSKDADAAITAETAKAAKLQSDMQASSKKAALDVFAVSHKANVEAKAAAIDIRKIELDIISQKRKLANETAESNNALKQAQLSSKIALGSITESQAIQEKFELDLNELRLSHANKLQDIEEEKNKKALEFELTLYKIKQAFALAASIAAIKNEENLGQIRQATELRIAAYKEGKITAPISAPQAASVDITDAQALVTKAIDNEKQLNQARTNTANATYANSVKTLELGKSTDQQLLKRKEIIDNTNKSLELLNELSGKLKDNFGQGGEEAAKLLDILGRSIKSRADYTVQSQRILTQAENIKQSILTTDLALKANLAQNDGPATAVLKAANAAAMAKAAASEHSGSTTAAADAAAAVAAQALVLKAELDRKTLAEDRIKLQQTLNSLKEDEIKTIKEGTTLELKNMADKKQAAGDFFALVKNGAGKQTAAYKLAAGYERKEKLNSAVTTAANFAQSMNLISAETALKISSTDDVVSAVASAAMKMMGIQVPVIFSSFMAALGPFGPPLASAAIAAFMGIASGGGEEYKPIDYEQYKKDRGQGTGTGGILGDSTATNTSIVNSLSYLAEAAKPEFAITSLMAKILQNIDNNTFELAYGKGGINSVDFLDSVKQASTETKEADLTATQGAVLGGAVGAALNSGTSALATAATEVSASLTTVAGNAAAVSTTAAATATTAGTTALTATAAATAAAAAAAVALSQVTFQTAAVAGITNAAAIAGAELGLMTAMSTSVAATATAATAATTATAATVAASTASAAATVAGAASTVASTAAAAASSVSGALASMATALGPIGLTILAGVVIFAAVPKIANAVKDFLFGSETVFTSLQGFGVVLQDQTLGLASSNIAVDGFKDTLVQVGKSAGFFEKLMGGGYTVSERIDRSAFTVNDRFKASLQKVYEGIGSSLTVASKSLKIDASKLSSTRIKGFEIDLSKGTDKEKQEKISGEITKQADALAESLLDGMQGRADVTDFRQKDESSYKTYMRLASAQEQANFYTEKLAISGRALADIDNKRGDVSAELLRESIMLSEGITGISEIMSTAQGSAANLYDTYNKLKEVQISLVSLGAKPEVVNADLVRGAGGSEALSQATKSFENIYLTSAERLKIKQTTVDEQFKKLGQTTPKTAEDFKQLVLTLAAAGPSSSYLLGSVLALSDSYKELTEATKDVTAANAVKLTNEIKIYELLGYKLKALELTRQKELDSLDKDLIASQKYIYALEDEIAARDKLNEVYKSTTASITNQIKSLKDFKTAFNTGASSILTPQEKYNLAKTDFESTAKAASAYIDINSTPADIAKRDDAVSNLSKTAETFRETSSVMFASGAQYVANVKSINDAIDSSISSLTVQETDIKKQLGFLDSIQESSKTTAQLLGDYLKLYGVSSLAKVASVNSGSDASTYANTISQKADGGLAEGITLVGEKGPEIVDFTTPGRVYSNAASNDIFSTKELVAEIKALRTELSTLRQEQKEQTGHIISSNYDANRKNADKLSEVTENAMNQQSWKERNKVVVA